MDERLPNPLVIAGILAVHLGVTALTWRDLRHRTDDEVRGSKRVWRIASALNTSGSVAYWILGRRGRVADARDSRHVNG
jgi:hypothetical protein